MKSMFFAAAAVLVAVPAQAADWFEVAKATDGTIVLVDLASIKRTGKQRDAWVKHDYSAVKSRAERSWVALNRVNCDTQRVAVISYVTYNASGNVIDSYSTDYPKFAPAVPDSVAFSVMEALCRLPDPPQ